MPRAITFNGYDLQSAGFRTSDLPHENGQLSVDVAQVGAYGGRVINMRVGTKDISLVGWISAANSDALDALVDTIKSNVYGKTGALDIAYNGGTRRYTAVCTGLEVKSNPRDLTMHQIGLKLTALGLGQGTTQVTNSYPGRTATYSTGAVTFTGTAAPRPAVVITVNSCTALSSITVTNGTTAKSLTITRTFAASDVIIIDCDAQKVTVNAISVYYTGVIPNFAAGANNVSVTPTATAVNYSLGINYYPLYL